jgi:hypothetical protein
MRMYAHCNLPTLVKNATGVGLPLTGWNRTGGGDV